MERGGFSFREISTQGESWHSAIAETLTRRQELRAWFGRHADRPILFAGCGSTHYLALFAAPFFQRVTGRACRGLPSSEVFLQADTIMPRSAAPLLIALSRSGETSETITAAEALRARGGEVLTISCYDQTPLAALSAGPGGVTIAIPGGREESYAQTRSFAGMLVAVQVVAALLADDEALMAALQRLPALAPEITERSRVLGQQLGPREEFQRITYLGSGPLYGLANEATVKMKEMSLSLAEGYHFMEFRHGPMSLVDEHHLIVGLLSEELRPYETAVLRDLSQRGARVLVMAEQDGGLSAEFEYVLTLQSGLPELARSVLYLPLLQWLAYYRSMSRGLNPDRPRNVVMSIQLKGTEMA